MAVAGASSFDPWVTSMPLADTDRPSRANTFADSATVAIAGLGITFAGYVAYGCAALIRIGAFDHWFRFLVGLSALALLWFAPRKSRSPSRFSC